MRFKINSLATFAAIGLACLASAASAASVSTVEQAVNIFASGPVTGGAPFTVDVADSTAIVPGVEFPGFAFGTYDVDVSSDSLTMTFANDPANLGIAVYDASTVDRYFFEFDAQIAAASLSNVTDGFAASVSLVAPGTMASSVASFVDGLPTEFTFANGGFLVSIGDGTDLFEVGTGGSLTVSFAPVPVPASLPLLLTGFAGIAVLRRKRRA